MPSTTEVLQKTDGGLKVFKLLVPELQMDSVKKKNVRNVDSKISEGKGCFSVFFYEKKGKYYFKDHSSGAYGDIFCYIAILYGWDQKKDFSLILKRVEDISEGRFVEEDDSIDTYANDETRSILALMNKQVSGLHMKVLYEALPFLESAPKYPVRMVHSFQNVFEAHFFEYNICDPKEIFFAFEIVEGQYYILYNPFSKKTYQWGTRPEYYHLGQEFLFKTTLSDNIYQRENLVFVNTIDALLFLQQHDIPCLGFLFGEEYLDKFTEEVILPHFSNYYLLFDEAGYRSGEQWMFSDIGFYQLNTKSSSLLQFLSKSGALDIILDQLVQCTDFVYEGVEPSERRISFSEMRYLDYYEF
jgi:hypothetical protein